MRIEDSKVRYYKAKRGQTLANVCMQMYGDFSMFLYFLNTNKVDIDKDVEDGEEFIYDIDYVNGPLIEIYKERNITLSNI